MDEPVYFPREVPRSWEELPHWKQGLHFGRIPSDGARSYAESTYILRYCCGREYVVGGAYFSDSCPTDMCVVLFCTCGASIGSYGDPDCPTCTGEFEQGEGLV